MRFITELPARPTTGGDALASHIRCYASGFDLGVARADGMDCASLRTKPTSPPKKNRPYRDWLGN